MGAQGSSAVARVAAGGGGPVRGIPAPGRNDLRRWEEFCLGLGSEAVSLRLEESTLEIARDRYD